MDMTRNTATEATTAAVMLVLVVAGCVRDPEPFRPRALQAQERARAIENTPATMPALPTTFHSPLDENFRMPPSADAANSIYGNGDGRTAVVEPGAVTRPTTPTPATSSTTWPTTDEAGATTTAPAGPIDIAAPTTAPVTQLDSSRPFRQALRISLKEVIQRTVAFNLDVRVASFDPAVEQTRVIEADARFDPTAFSSIQYQDSKILTPSQGLDLNANPFSPTISRVTQFQAGVRQLLTNGAQVELRTGIQRVGRNTFIEPNPYYVNDVTLQITQPLLRDFGYPVNQARIVIARNTQRVSLLEFRKTLEDNLELGERTYWQLVQAERELAIAERLYNETLNTVDLLRKRVGQDVSRVQVSQAYASAETRAAALLRARQQVQNASDQLKQIMNDPDMPVSSGTTLLSGTDPLEIPVSFTLEDQIKTALDYRLELGQQQLRIDSAEVARQVAKNNLLPSLNLQGTFGLQGVGEDVSDAYSTIDEQDFNTWSLGFVLEIPIGNRAARAIYQRSLLQLQQAYESYRSLIERVALDVKQQLRDVEVSYNEIAATRRARFAAADELAALQQLEDANEPLSPDFVNRKLDSQGRLADAARAEAAAISNYNIALARLEKAKGTLLRYNNVQMQEEPRPFGSRPK
jgi:outer membrane protein